MKREEALERVAEAATAFHFHFGICSLSAVQLVRWVGEYHELIGRLEFALADLRHAEVAGPTVEVVQPRCEKRRQRGRRAT